MMWLVEDFIAHVNIKIYFKAMQMEKMRSARRHMCEIKFHIAENFEGLIAECARLW